MKGLCRLLHRSTRKSYFCILNNTYPIYVNSRLTALFCSELNRALPIRIPLSRQSIVVFEAIQNTRSACFIRSKTLGLRPRVLNLIKHCFSCFKYYLIHPIFIHRHTIHILGLMTGSQQRPSSLRGSVGRAPQQYAVS